MRSDAPQERRRAWRGVAVVVLGALLAVASLYLSPAKPRTPVHMMPLGDSITGKRGQFSYRYWLWRWLEEEGYEEVDFVGSQSDPAAPAHDPDHEGHGGWTARQLLAGNPRHPDAGSLSTWAARFTPDLVMLVAGTNDLAGASCLMNARRCSEDEQAAAYDAAIDGALGAVDGAVDELRRANPSVAIVVGRIPPIIWVPDREVGRYNDGLTALAERKRTASSPVLVVDLHDGMDWTLKSPERDTADGIHPNAKGSRRIAERLSTVLPEMLGALGATPGR